MNFNDPALALPLLFLGLAALWCGVSKIIGLLGWRRLAASYQVDQTPAIPRQWLSLAYVGSIQYQRVIRAGASAEGLVLTVIFPFRVGHPPLLIPWHAIGPIHNKKKWLRSMYSIRIRTGDITSLDFEFEDDSFLAVLRHWLSVAEVR